MRSFTIAALAAALVVASATSVVHLQAQAKAPAQAGTVVSKKDPLRFRAFGVNMQGGIAGTLDIVVERWSTDAERTVLLDQVAGTSSQRSDQDKLVKSLQDIEPRTGYIRTSRSLGWDLKYARENVLEDGSRQLVIVTDKPVSFFAAANRARTMDYPFTMIEMRFPAGSDKGEGKILNQTSISTKNGRLETRDLRAGADAPDAGHAAEAEGAEVTLPLRRKVAPGCPSRAPLGYCGVYQIGDV